MDRGIVVVGAVVAILGGLACSSQDGPSSGSGGAPGIGGEFSKGVGGFPVGDGGAGAGGAGAGGAGAGGSVATIDDGGLLGAPCRRVSDCGFGRTCGYKVSDGCSAQGVCVGMTPPIGQAACGALVSYCSCDGVTTVTAGCTFAAGYAPAPVMSGAFACPTDAGSGADAGSTCSGWGAICGTCCDGLVCMPSNSSALPSICVKP